MHDWIKSRSINWDGESLQIIDQTKLPFAVSIISLRRFQDYCNAIQMMQIRGAPLIGIVAAYGTAILCKEVSTKTNFEKGLKRLLATRPTAVNLQQAVEWQLAEFEFGAIDYYNLIARAHLFLEKEIQNSVRIAEYGADLILNQFKLDRTINIMTHCNAGRLATCMYGTATAPIYKLAEKDIPVHVWVSETRPRNQGSLLTAWELQQAGIDYTIFIDNASGYIVNTGNVDFMLVGADRIAMNGDVANKVGTYLKALLAREYKIPFLVAAPSSTFDIQAKTGLKIPIEERDSHEVLRMTGVVNNEIQAIQVATEPSQVRNPGFDITPAELVTAYITEIGVIKAGQITSQFSNPGS